MFDQLSTLSLTLFVMLAQLSTTVIYNAPYVCVAGCRCRLHITYEGSFEDQSCSRGHVTQEGPVDVYILPSSGLFNLTGVFDGVS